MALSGQITVTTAGTAVQGSDVPGSIFALKAHPDNTDTAWVGEDGAGDVAAANGFPLNPGETVVVEVVAPTLTPRRSGRRVKTDPIDARKLVLLFRAGELTEIAIPNEQDEEVR